MEFLNKDCQGIVLQSGQGEYKVIGRLNNISKKNIQNQKLMFIAANSPTYLIGYTGSGLPYPNKEVAFENTTNKGIVAVQEDGSFSFKIDYPNSYYKHLGSKLIEPHIYIKLCGNDKIHEIKLGKGIPNRFLHSEYKYKYGKEVKEDMIIKSQETLLREKGI